MNERPPVTYNVFIQDLMKQFLLALTEDDLAKVIEAHDTGAEKISIPGERVAYFSHFIQIRIFMNTGSRTSQQVASILDQSAGRFGRDGWNERILAQLGKEVTREKVKLGFGEKPVTGALATLVVNTSGAGLWNILHPRLTEVSRRLYEDGHFKQAALDAFIEIDERVGKAMAGTPGSKKTGKDMMLAAFAEDAPIIKLFPSSNPDAKTMQEGYKFIFAGVMLAIRNPKGHRNFTIEEKDAIELLFIASRLLRKLDEALPPPLQWTGRPV